MREVTVFVCCFLALVRGLPMSGRGFWNYADTTGNEEEGALERWRREVVDYESFGSLGALMEFGESVNKNVTVTCTACKAAAEGLKYFLKDGYTEPELLDFIHSICIDLKIMSEPICDGFTKNVGPVLLTVVNATTLSPLQICAFLVGNNCGEVSNPNNEWEVPLPPVSKPPLQIPVPPPDGGKRLRVLHISDTHIDLHYQEGAVAECGDPLCCRAESKPSAEGDIKVAGKWGSWKCDGPMITLDSMLQHAAGTHKDLDYVIWTGDLPSHDIWDQTRESILVMLRTTAQKIRDAFPNIPIYPAIGNHDSAPINSFPSPEVGGSWNISWLYEELVNEWGSTYLSTNEVIETIRKGAYYSTLVRPGFRIISVNLNYCYLSNWWLMVNSTDPAQELAWLTEELQKAEYSGEKVHIIGHIPPGHTDCLVAWSKIYARLISRYEGTVVAQFFGHSHTDEFEVYYDVENNTRPVAVSYVGPGVSTYTDLNPGYRIYDVDGDRQDSTRLVLDHETWMFDLDQANRDGEPKWTKSYTVKEEYGMPSLLPEEWDTLYRRLQTDDQLFDLYYQHLTKESPVRKNCTSPVCRKGKFCAIRSCALFGDPILLN